MSFSSLSNKEKYELLSSESVVLEILAKILLKYPDKEYIKNILDEDLFSDIPYSENQPSTIKGLELLSSWQNNNRIRQEDSLLSDLRADYTGLFLNTSVKNFSPWESVYLGDEPSLFQESTLNVRNWYRRFGLQIENIYKEPDDHIGLELSFISHLSRLALSALEENQNEKFNKIIGAKKDFLFEHPKKWGVAWANQVHEYAKTDFYRGVALIIKGVLFELGKNFDLDAPKG